MVAPNIIQRSQLVGLEHVEMCRIGDVMYPALPMPNNATLFVER